MNKQLFLYYMEKLRGFLEYIDKTTDALQVILPNDHISGLDYGHIVDSYINLLAFVTKDESEWINYFVWELDFGAKWKPGMVTDKEKDIKLQTLDDLWTILN